MVSTSGGGGRNGHLTLGAHRRERPQLCHQRQDFLKTFQTRENVDFVTLLAVLAARWATTGKLLVPRNASGPQAPELQGNCGSRSRLLACYHSLPSFPHYQRRRVKSCCGKGRPDCSELRFRAPMHVNALP